MITPGFLATVVALSVSGVVGPGPLFVSSTVRATKHGWITGVQSAAGHTMVEAPLVFGLAVGLSSILNPSVAKLIGVPSGAVLIGFAALQIRHAINKNPLDIASASLSQQDRRSGVLLGVLFTAANPFFLVWWLTIGSTLIIQALALGALVGVALMFAAHIWMDYVWLGGTAYVANRGRLFLGKWYRGLLLVFGVVMGYFGIVFILSGLS